MVVTQVAEYESTCAGGAFKGAAAQAALARPWLVPMPAGNEGKAAALLGDATLKRQLQSFQKVFSGSAVDRRSGRGQEVVEPDAAFCCGRPPRR